MNVLYIADPGAIHDRMWIEAFSGNGINCYVVPRKIHAAGLPDQQNGSPSYTILKPISDPSVINPLRELRSLVYLRAVIRQYRIDLLHIMYAEPNALWARYKSLLKVPILITTRGSDVLCTIPAFSASDSWLNREISRRYAKAFRLADAISCTSLSQQQAVLRIYGEAGSKTSLVRTGVDVAFIREAQRNGAVEHDIPKPFILMPRNMKPVYNHEFTVEAISKLPAGIRRKYSFVFVNADSAYPDYAQKVTRLAGDVDARIIFLPALPHAQMLSLLQQAELAVMNPLSDGSPVSAMEAMVSKVPVILGPICYDQELFEGTTFRLQEWSSEELANTICRVLAFSAIEKDQWVERAYQTSCTIAGREVEMNKVINIYRKLCS